MSTGHRVCGDVTYQFDGDPVNVAACTLDEPDALEPEVTVFTRARCLWNPIDPSLPDCEAQPSRKPKQTIRPPASNDRSQP